MNAPTSRRSLLAGIAAAIAAIPASTSLALASNADPLVDLVAEWEPLYIAAMRATKNLNAADEEMQLRGFSNHYAMIFFGPSTTWRSVEQIEAYYSRFDPRDRTIAAIRDKYVRQFEEKMAARKELDIDNLEEASNQAWAREGELCERILETKATTIAGVRALIRYALRNMCEEDDPEDWPPEARALASSMQDLEQMAGGVA